MEKPKKEYKHTSLATAQHMEQQPQVSQGKKSIKKVSELYAVEPGLVEELNRRRLLNEFCLKHKIENDFVKPVPFGKAGIRRIAKKYGFGIEFSGMYETFPTTMFWRLNDDENDAYFSLGPKGPGFTIDELRKPNLTTEQEAYIRKYELPGLEEDRFEDAESCEQYFSYFQEKFFTAYPQFRK